MPVKQLRKVFARRLSPLPARLMSQRQMALAGVTTVHPAVKAKPPPLWLLLKLASYAIDAGTSELSFEFSYRLHFL